MPRSALLLDRDGTLIEDPGYLADPALVRLIPGAAEALRRLQGRFALVVVSNQSGVGRGLIAPEQAGAVHERFVEELAAHDVRLAGSYYCPHGPDEDCACRKPRTGMLDQAARELDLDLPASWMVGDKESDVQAGAAAGAMTIRLGPGPSGADHVASDWRAIEDLLAGAVDSPPSRSSRGRTHSPKEASE
jgi:histidinol-phosphate phosphatase family protein